MKNDLRIIADENIPLAEEVFSTLGKVTKVPSRAIENKLLLDADMVIVRSVTKVNRDLLEGTHVTFVGTATTGYDHIDTTWLTEQQIGFGSAPGSNATSVAEYITAVVLFMTRKLKIPLKDCRLGIVGAGNVGSRVYKRARALGMQCLFCDPPLAATLNSDLFVDLNRLLAESDIVTVHVPLHTMEPWGTYHMVNHQFLQAMKEGASLINTSRGAVLDEDALHANRNRLGMVALDVWNNEPTVAAVTIRTADIATSHIAGYSLDGKYSATEMVYRAASSFVYQPPLFDFHHAIGADALTLDLAESTDPIYDAVLQAYPLLRDDGALRGLLGKTPRVEGEAFEMLRKQYPRRREFSRYSVVNAPLESRNLLRQLSFTVKE